MDIEELSKAQIVLLTLLVSFVTSIATGVVTVSLMDQAPPKVKQTVHRVVERTVETVSPKGDKQQAGAGDTQTVKEVTQVVRENDLITSAIQKNAPSLVRIRIASETGTTTQSAPIAALGVIVSKDGIIATDASAVTSKEQYVADMLGKEQHPIKVVDTTDTSIALLKASTTKTTFTPISFVNEENVQLGQTAIALSGTSHNRVAVGIVTQLEEQESKATSSNATSSAPTQAAFSQLEKVYTDIDKEAVNAGGTLISMFNEFLGMYTTSLQTERPATFLPANRIREALREYRENAATQQDKDDAQTNT